LNGGLTGYLTTSLDGIMAASTELIRERAAKWRILPDDIAIP
jgi:hypothetical protein